MIRKSALAAAVCLMAGMPVTTGQAAEIRVTSFPGASNLPLWIAEAQGLFAREGVTVTFTPTTGSVQQIKDFYAGKADVIGTAFDNIVAYAEGQSDIPLPAPYDMVAVAGVHGAMESLLSTPEIGSFADLKGKTMASDALRSGYALVMYDLIKQKAGLDLDKDYSVVAVGNSDHRLEAMRDKKAVAGMIGVPQDMDAIKHGFRLLADADTELGPYQGSVMVVHSGWAKSHESDLAPFLRALSAAHDVIYSDKAATIAALKTHIKALSDADAEALYARLTRAGGINRHPSIDPAAVQGVLRIRETYGVPQKKMRPMSAYVDSSYLERALAAK